MFFHTPAPMTEHDDSRVIVCKQREKDCMNEPTIRTILRTGSLVVISFILALIAHQYPTESIGHATLLLIAVAVNLTGMVSFAFLVEQPNGTTLGFFLTPVIIIALVFGLVTWSIMAMPYMLVAVFAYALSALASSRKAKTD